MDEGDPDAVLIERIARGEAAATRVFVAAKLPRILGLATRMLGDRGEAEDVAQEVFVRVWKAAARWEPGRARFDTWLHTVILNLCRDRLRRRREPTAGDAPEPADPSADAEAAMLADEQGRRVAAAIALPERQREAILLVHYQELSGSAAAAVLEVSVDALESLLARGRRTLRTRLAAGQEHDDGG